MHSFDSNYDWLCAIAQREHGQACKAPLLQKRFDLVLLQHAYDSAMYDSARLTQFVWRTMQRLLSKGNGALSISRMHEHRRMMLLFGLLPLPDTQRTVTLLEKQQPNIALLQGARENDIVREAILDRGIDTLLVEMRDDLAGDATDRLLDALATALCAFVDQRSRAKRDQKMAI